MLLRPLLPRDCLGVWPTVARPNALFRKISKIDGRHVQVGPGSRNLNMVRPPENRKRQILFPRHPSEEAQMIPIRNAVPSRYPPAVTWMLIATNCLVFLFQDSLSPNELELFLRQFALIPARYSEVLASGDSDLAAADLFPFFSMMFS